jgi:hypothetical protein
LGWPRHTLLAVLAILGLLILFESISPSVVERRLGEVGSLAVTTDAELTFVAAISLNVAWAWGMQELLFETISLYKASSLVQLWKDRFTAS